MGLPADSSSSFSVMPPHFAAGMENSLELKGLHDLDMEHVKKAASHVFDKHAKTDCNWNASAWSTKVRSSAILKNGDTADLSQLSPSTRHNESHAGTSRKKRRQTCFPIRVGRDVAADDTAAEVLNGMLRQSDPQDPGIAEQLQADCDAMMEAGRQEGARKTSCAR